MENQPGQSGVRMCQVCDKFYSSLDFRNNACSPCWKWFKLNCDDYFCFGESSCYNTCRGVDIQDSCTPCRIRKFVSVTKYKGTAQRCLSCGKHTFWNSKIPKCSSCRKRDRHHKANLAVRSCNCNGTEQCTWCVLKAMSQRNNCLQSASLNRDCRVPTLKAITECVVAPLVKQHLNESKYQEDQRAQKINIDISIIPLNLQEKAKEQLSSECKIILTRLPIRQQQIYLNLPESYPSEHTVALDLRSGNGSSIKSNLLHDGIHEKYSNVPNALNLQCVNIINSAKCLLQTSANTTLTRTAATSFTRSIPRKRVHSFSGEDLSSSSGVHSRTENMIKDQPVEQRHAFPVNTFGQIFPRKGRIFRGSETSIPCPELVQPESVSLNITCRSGTAEKSTQTEPLIERLEQRIAELECIISGTRSLSSPLPSITSQLSYKSVTSESTLALSTPPSSDGFSSPNREMEIGNFSSDRQVVNNLHTKESPVEKRVSSTNENPNDIATKNAVIVLSRLSEEEVQRHTKRRKPSPKPLQPAKKRRLNSSSSVENSTPRTTTNRPSGSLKLIELFGDDDDEEEDNSSSDKPRENSEKKESFSVDDLNYELETDEDSISSSSLVENAVGKYPNQIKKSVDSDRSKTQRKNKKDENSKRGKQKDKEKMKKDQEKTKPITTKKKKQKLADVDIFKKSEKSAAKESAASSGKFRIPKVATIGLPQLLQENLELVNKGSSSTCSNKVLPPASSAITESIDSMNSSKTPSTIFLDDDPKSDLPSESFQLGGSAAPPILCVYRSSSKERKSVNFAEQLTSVRDISPRSQSQEQEEVIPLSDSYVHSVVSDLSYRPVSSPRPPVEGIRPFRPPVCKIRTGDQPSPAARLGRRFMSSSPSSSSSSRDNSSDEETTSSQETTTSEDLKEVSSRSSKLAPGTSPVVEDREEKRNDPAKIPSVEKLLVSQEQLPLICSPGNAVEPSLSSTNQSDSSEKTTAAKTQVNTDSSEEIPPSRCGTTQPLAEASKENYSEESPAVNDSDDKNDFDDDGDFILDIGIRDDEMDFGLDDMDYLGVSEEVRMVEEMISNESNHDPTIASGDLVNSTEESTFFNNNPNVRAKESPVTNGVSLHSNLAGDVPVTSQNGVQPRDNFEKDIRPSLTKTVAPAARTSIQVKAASIPPQVEDTLSVDRGLCFDYLRLGKCQEKYRKCSFSHNLEPNAILGYLQSICQNKNKLQLALRLVCTMTNAESPLSRELFSDTGKKIVTTVISAFVKDNRPELIQYALDMMKNPKFPLIVELIEPILTVLPRSATFSSQVFALYKRCISENAKMSVLCWNKVAEFLIATNNWTGVCEVIEAAIKCNAISEPSLEVLDFVFREASSTRQNLMKACILFQGMGQRALLLLGKQRRSEILDRLIEFDLVDWHDFYSGIVHLPPSNPCLPSANRQMQPHFAPQHPSNGNVNQPPFQWMERPTVPQKTQCFPIASATPIPVPSQSFPFVHSQSMSSQTRPPQYIPFQTIPPQPHISQHRPFQPPLSQPRPPPLHPSQSLPPQPRHFQPLPSQPHPLQLRPAQPLPSQTPIVPGYGARNVNIVSSVSVNSNIELSTPTEAPRPSTPLTIVTLKPQAPLVTLQVPKPTQALDLHLFSETSVNPEPIILQDKTESCEPERAVESTCTVEEKLLIEYEKQNFGAVITLFFQHYSGIRKCPVLGKLVSLVKSNPLYKSNDTDEVKTLPEIMTCLLFNACEHGAADTLEQRSLQGLLDLIYCVLFHLWQLDKRGYDENDEDSSPCKLATYQLLQTFQIFRVPLRGVIKHPELLLFVSECCFQDSQTEEEKMSDEEYASNIFLCIQFLIEFHQLIEKTIVEPSLVKKEFDVSKLLLEGVDYFSDKECAAEMMGAMTEYQNAGQPNQTLFHSLLPST